MNFLTTTLIWFGFLPIPNGYNTYEYYENAFKDVYLSLWNYTGYENRFTIKQKCFYRAMTCLYDSNISDLLDRRSLMYNYLVYLYKTKSIYDTLNRYKAIIENGSSIKRLLKLKCKHYDSEVTRVFSENENTNQLLTDLYTSSNIDSQLRNVYLKGKLTGLVAVLPKLNNDIIELVTLTPENFNYKIRNNVIIEFVYPSMTNDGIVFIEWTPDFRTIFKIDNNRKRIIEQTANIYNVVPVVFFELDGTMFTACENQLKINKFNFQSEQDVDFNTNPYKLATNIESNKFTNALDEIMVVNGIRNDDGKEQPRIDITSTSPNYIALNEYVTEKKVQMFEDEGVPRSMVYRDGEMSGYALYISQLELYEQMYEDETTLIQYENDLLNMIVLVVNTDSNENNTINYNINVNDISLNINYPTLSITLTPLEEYNLDKMKLMDKQISKKSFLMKYGGLKSNSTIEEAVEYVNKRNEEDLLLNFSVGVASEPNF